MQGTVECDLITLKIVIPGEIELGRSGVGGGGGGARVRGARAGEWVVVMGRGAYGGGVCWSVYAIFTVVATLIKMCKAVPTTGLI